jgi:hypothetical protein
MAVSIERRDSADLAKTRKTAAAACLSERLTGLRQCGLAARACLAGNLTGRQRLFEMVKLNNRLGERLISLRPTRFS